MADQVNESVPRRKRTQTPQPMPQRVSQAAVQNGYRPQYRPADPRYDSQQGQGTFYGRSLNYSAYPRPNGNNGQPYPGMQQPMQNRPMNQPSGMFKNVYTGSNGYIPPATGSDRPAGGRLPEPPKKHTALKILAAAAAVTLLAAAAVFGRRASERHALENWVAAYDNVYADGVYVDGISLAGMTAQEGYDAVAAQARTRSDAWYVNITYEGHTFTTLNASQLGMQADISDVMNEAWSYGHTGTAQERRTEIERLQAEPWYGYTAVPGSDTSVLDSILAQIKAAVDRSAVNAQMIAFVPGESYPFTFREEVVGLSLDTEPIKKELYRMVSSMESGAVEIVPDQIRPTVTVASLKENLSMRASVYTPIAKSSTDNRNNNIRRCFEMVNGTVLQPGKKFSFNTVVGQRTLKNGFFEAIEYAYGEHVTGVGGGSCQASTTLYQAAVLAGLDIIEREPHSDSVSYTDYGKDATVYWVGKRKIDLVFRNSTDQPIYIVAAVETDPSNKSRLVARVTMYGASLGETRYELQTETTEILEPPTQPVYVEDKNHTYVTYTDQQKSVSKAKEGYVVVSYRVTYQGDTEVERRQLFKDTYKAKAERIYVGTEKREAN